MQLGTAAFTAALRHPLLGAHTAATVDQLSNGRLILGLGAGFPLPETLIERHTDSGEFGRHLASELVRRNRIRRPLLATRRPDPDPAGREQERSPLWLAGSDSPRVLERVARRYDGWLPFLPYPGAYSRAWRTLREKTTRNVTPALYATININPDSAAARTELDNYVNRYYRRSRDEMSTIQAYFGGSANECVDWLGRCLDAGARHLVLRIGSLQARRQLDLLAEATLQTA